MPLWVKITLVVFGLAGVGIWSTIWFCSASWNSRTSQLVEKLALAPSQIEGKTVTFEGFEQLPAPVARYFRWALKEGQPLIRSARIEQAGEFRTSQTENGWSPFEAKQYFSMRSPGFVWDAEIRMAPLMKVRVRDAYIASQGSMQGKILSIIPVVDEHEKAELNSGALQRYLAEAAWFPTALLPGERVKWSPIDEHRALATWIDQFGTSGCIGCGRCITWCPVGIDITEEVDAIRKSETERAEP